MANNDRPPATTPKDTRLILRVSAADLEFWRYIVEQVEFRSLSAMIRDVVNRYVADPPPSLDVREMAEVFAERSHYDKTIFLRVSATDRQRWTRVAQQSGDSLSGMIRRAVKRHAWFHMDIIRYAQKRGG